MPVIKLVAGASLSGLKYQMRASLITVERVWSRHGVREVTITSGLDGEHSPRSYHYYGYALDFRIRQFPESLHEVLKHELRRELGFLYDVVLHKNSHIHIEFDVERYKRKMFEKGVDISALPI